MEPRDYLRIPRKSWVLIVSPLGDAAAAGVSIATRSKYVSTTEL